MDLPSLIDGIAGRRKPFEGWRTQAGLMASIAATCSRLSKRSESADMSLNASAATRPSAFSG
jgi:hypothetical protein